jgi:hypothetical protein
LDVIDEEFEGAVRAARWCAEIVAPAECAICAEAPAIDPSELSPQLGGIHGPTVLDANLWKKIELWSTEPAKMIDG